MVRGNTGKVADMEGEEGLVKLFWLSNCFGDIIVLLYQHIPQLVSSTE